MAVKAPAVSPNGGITAGPHRFMEKFRIWTHIKQLYRAILDMNTHYTVLLLY